MKCSFIILNVLEEISSLSHFIVFFYFFFKMYVKLNVSMKAVSSEGSYEKSVYLALLYEENTAK